MAVGDCRREDSVCTWYKKEKFSTPDRKAVTAYESWNLIAFIDSFGKKRNGAGFPLHAQMYGVPRVGNTHARLEPALPCLPISPRPLPILSYPIKFHLIPSHPISTSFHRLLAPSFVPFLHSFIHSFIHSQPWLKSARFPSRSFPFPSSFPFLFLPLFPANPIPSFHPSFHPVCPFFRTSFHPSICYLRTYLLMTMSTSFPTHHDAGDFRFSLSDSVFCSFYFIFSGNW